MIELPFKINEVYTVSDIVLTYKGKLLHFLASGNMIFELQGGEMGQFDKGYSIVIPSIVRTDDGLGINLFSRDYADSIDELLDKTIKITQRDKIV